MAVTPQHMAREIIAANIRSLMGRHRVTQKRIGELIDLTQGPVSQRLGGHIPFDTDELLTIAAEFNVEVSVLFEGLPGQDSSHSRWIPMPTDSDIWDIPVTQCEGQLPLLNAA